MVESPIFARRIALRDKIRRTFKPSHPALVAMRGFFFLAVT